MATIILYLYLLIGFMAAVIYGIYLLNIDKEAFNKDLDYYCLVQLIMPLSWIISIPILLYFNYKNNKK